MTSTGGCSASCTPTLGSRCPPRAARSACRGPPRPRACLPPPAVTERVQRLQRAGVITGFSMTVDPAALGLPVTAFVRVRPAARQLSKIAALAESLDNVSECHRITGEDCFLVKVHAATIPELEATLDRFLMYGQTVSSIVVTTPVPPRPLPIPD